MMLEQHRCLIDEACIEFKTKVHDLLFNVDNDEDMSDIDRELYRMHVVDLYEELSSIMG